MAENVAESVTRGTRLIVQGRLRQRSLETREGEKRTVVELDVDDVGVSLRFATAKVNKVGRSGGRPDSSVPDDPWRSAPTPAMAGTGGGEPPF